MDIYKRSLAPIIDEAWAEIDQFAKEIFTTHLSARKFVDLEGPMGQSLRALTLETLSSLKVKKAMACLMVLDRCYR